MSLIQCAGCQRKLKTTEEMAGKKIRCPVCQTICAVPADGPSAPEPPLLEIPPAVGKGGNPDQTTFASEPPPRPTSRAPRDKDRDEGEDGDDREGRPRQDRERPRSDRATPRRKGGLAVLWVVLGTLGGMTVLLCGGGVALVYAIRNRPIPASDWQVFSPAGENYSVTMPGTPTLNNTALAGAQGNKYVLERKANNLVYVVAHIEIPAMAPTANTLRLLQQGERDELLRQMKGKVVAEKDLTLGTVAGREFQIEAPDRSLTIGRLYITPAAVGSHTYLLLAAGPRGRVDAGDGNQFFDSFRFLNEVKALPEVPNPAVKDPPQPPIKPTAPPDERAVWTEVGGEQTLALAFSADGTTLASGHWDRKLRLWDVGASADRALLTSLKGPVFAVTYSTDGKRLATGGGSGVVSLRDPATGKELRTFQVLHSRAKEHGQIKSLAFAPDGKTLAVAIDGNDGEVHLCDLQPGGKTRGPLPCGDKVSRVVLTPDGFVVALVSNAVKVWDARSLRLVREFTEVDFNGPLITSALSNDGKTLATLGDDKKLMLWRLATGENLKTWSVNPQVHRHAGFPLAFSPDDSLIVLGTQGPALSLFDPKTGEEKVWELGGSSGFVGLLAFRPDGKLLALQSSNGPRIVEIAGLIARSKAAAKRPRPTAPAGERPVWASVGGEQPLALAFSPDGATLAAGQWNKMLRLWDVEAAENRAVSYGLKGPVFALAFSPGGRQIALSGPEGRVTLRDPATGKELRTFQVLHSQAKEHGQIKSLAFAPDGTTLAVAIDGNQGEVHLCDLTAGGRPRGVLPCGEKVTRVVFTPAGFVVGHVSSAVKVWDGRSFRLVREYKAADPKEALISSAVSRDGKTLATLGDDKTLKLWRLTTGENLKTWTVKVNVSRHFGHSMAFSPDGKLLALGAVHDSVTLLDTTTGRERKVAGDGSRSAALLCFSPDGRLLALQGYHGPKILVVAAGEPGPEP